MWTPLFRSSVGGGRPCVSLRSVENHLNGGLVLKPIARFSHHTARLLILNGVRLWGLGWLGHMLGGLLPPHPRAQRAARPPQPPLIRVWGAQRSNVHAKAHTQDERQLVCRGAQERILPRS